MAAKNPKVDEVIAKSKQWKPELEKLRSILLNTELTEDFKWWQPCYTYNGANLVILGQHKDSCVFSFFRGALLKDEHKILSFPGENSQSAKVIKFKSVAEIEEVEPILKEYVKEAIEAEKKGLKVKFKNITENEFPEELEQKFKENKEFEKAFKELTPGKQRAWVLHFSGAKQSQTRTSRIEKAMDDILAGKGFNEDYAENRKKK